MPVYPTGYELREGELRIRWSDGHESLHEYRFLRESCPCALCKGEPGLYPGVGRIPPRPRAPEGIKALAITPIGRYALQIHWSDGHETGYYTYELLRSLCQCSACRPR